MSVGNVKGYIRLKWRRTWWFYSGISSWWR